MKRILILLCLSIIPYFSKAQKINERFQMNIQKTTGKVLIDGVLNEQAWFDAAAVSDFMMCNPFDSLCAQVRTDVKMAYDDKYLYISAECFLKEPGAFVVESMKRDFSFGVNDNFLVFIDTFEDKTTGFAFGANAAGAQWDGQMSEGAKVNLNWDNKWESATTYKRDSWIFEAAIPFKSIRYKDNVKRWGINFSRYDLKAK
ncbi:MAG: carbohydrate binding family 9 domain-containing protein, partial [Aquirufa sp.]